MSDRGSQKNGPVKPMAPFCGFISARKPAAIEDIRAMAGSPARYSSASIPARPRAHADAECVSTVHGVEAAVNGPAAWSYGWRLGNRILLWDGEIYNHAQILRSLGLRHDAPAPELVMRGIDRWGIPFLRRINGPFALALFDLQAATWLLARGRQGLRPLFWFESSHGIAFARDLPTLFRCSWVPREPHWERVPEYLVFDHVAGGETLYRNIRELLPGVVLSGVMGSSAVEKGRLDHESPLRFSDRPDKAQQAHGFLRSATSRLLRCRDSGPGVLFLSGGVDSALLADALEGSTHGDPVSALTVTCPGYRHDESEFARRIRDEKGLPGVEIPLSPGGFAKAWAEAIGALASPLTSTNQGPWWVLCEEARSRGWSIVFSGEGADGWFSGGLYDEEIRGVRDSLDRDPEEAASHVVLCRTHRLNDPGLIGDILTIPLDLASRRRIWEEVRMSAPGAPVEEQAVLYHVRTTGHRLLSRADLVAACHGVRLRLPYMEDNWIRWVRSMPWAIRNAGGVRKAPLKALCAARFGKDLAHRRKIGFPFPLRTWIRDADDSRLAWWRDMLLDSTTLGRGLYRRPALERAVRDRLEGRVRPADWLLWSLINLELWLRQTEDVTRPAP
jgi:asparagine synthase (glutamine-hydrolysing)